MLVLPKDIDLDGVADEVEQERCNHDEHRKKNVPARHATLGSKAVAQAEKKLVHEGKHRQPVCERTSDFDYLPDGIVCVGGCILKAEPDVGCEKQ